MDVEVQRITAFSSMTPVLSPLPVRYDGENNPFRQPKVLPWPWLNFL